VDWDTAGLADTDDALSKQKAPAIKERPNIKACHKTT